MIARLWARQIKVAVPTQETRCTMLRVSITLSRDIAGHQGTGMR